MNLTVLKFVAGSLLPIVLWLSGVEHCQAPESSAKSTLYKIARTYRSDEKENKLILIISVDPNSFERDKMKILVDQIDRDFANEQRLFVAILDNEERARNFRPFGGQYNLSMKSERGEFYLDRRAGVKYLMFSTQRGKPVTEIKVNYGKRLPR